MPGEREATSLRVELGERSYEVVIGPGVLEEIGERCRALGLGTRALVITNETVGRLYGGVVVKSLRNSGFDVHYAAFPDGEEYKSLKTAASLYDACVDAGLDRGSWLVALGGGVVGDVAGFVAATYMRGIDFVQVPTTLLAQVDSSVGGKTGVNHSRAKNLIGAFYQPRLVLADVATLVSLSPREYRSGLAEVVKAGLIRDARFFEYLEREWLALSRLDPAVLTQAVRRSVEIKAAVVAADEREAGERAILNYGHTVGHALEAAAGYGRITHGEAVSIGMVVEGKLSVDLGLLEPAALARIELLLSRLGLPTSPGDVSYEAAREAMRLDKKALAGKLRFALLERIGAATIVTGVSEEALAKAFGPQAHAAGTL